MLRTLVCVAMLSILLPEGLAASPSAPTTSDDETATYKKKRQQELASIIGKKLYYYPRNSLCNAPRIQRKPEHGNFSDEFVVTAPVAIIVLSVVQGMLLADMPGPTDYYFYKLALPDGSAGYMDTSGLFFRLNDDPLHDTGCFSKFSPTQVAAAQKGPRWEQMRRNREIAERTSKLLLQSIKPVARLGMTSQQVREETNWGEPDRIQRRLDKHGLTEVWSYGENRVLYFKDDVLTAIEN